ncbi:uncharacterized protein [Amphiura filiformis]|uniref:uncharacterized protein n=1 Tax=Amphiura filiformis TaxID=82378 RepID=UPI003B2199EE
MGASVDKLDASNIDFHECIGEGGFGSVSRVSFKKPYKGYTEAASKTVLYALAKKEVEVMSKLHHPHIVNLLGICEIPSAKLILMEYAPNGSLHDYLKDPSKPLPYELQKKWAKESALAITYLHRQNFLHRDIKPQNCLLFQDNLLKLCDFGLAREIEESQTTSSQKGTYRYMAPEIHVGNERGRAIYSKPADIWAYGMLLLEICTRKPPFQDLEWHRVIFEVGNGTKPSIPEGCPKDLSDIMQQCWNNDPKQRPTSAIITMALGACWSLEREIHPEHQGKELGCYRIACCPNGDMVVSCTDELYLLDGDGKCKMQLRSTDMPIGHVCNICVSPLGYIFVASVSCRFVHVFTTEGKYLRCFTPDSNTSPKWKCLAIDRKGQLLVGDRERDIITIHTCPDGTVVNKIKCSLGYGSGMVVNSKNQILIHSHPSDYSKVVATDYSGNEVFSFTPKIVQDMTGRQSVSHGILCDHNDNIYVAMSRCEYNTGHIHAYSPKGEFLQCLTTRLYSPLDLSMTPGGSLVVANETSILKYSLKYIKMGASVDKLDASNIDFHECIGEGGFGSVSRVSFKKPYKGYKEAASKTVLYKLAKKEAEVMSKLHHPHIVNLLGICEIPSVKLILMEYAPNGSLHDYLKDPSKPLPYQLQKKWAKESALAITYLHGQNFLHRDIKPQNCLLFQDNLLKLCDFGLAREIEESQTTSSQKGTYRYMAPEIHVGNERGRAIYSKPADIWAYGMLLLAICTRKPPFEDLEWHRVVFEVGNGAKPSLPKSCPKDLSDIMQQCWNNDPKQQPTSALIALALGACWSLEREIHPEHQGKQLGCCHIACCLNGDIVMAAWEKLVPS